MKNKLSKLKKDSFIICKKCSHIIQKSSQKSHEKTMCKLFIVTDIIEEDSSSLYSKLRPLWFLALPISRRSCRTRV